MTIKPWTAVLVLLPALAAAAPTVAQDLPTDQIERHADVVRQDMLLKSTLRQSGTRQTEHTTRATPRQAAACAKKAEFRRQYGASHPKVRQLYGLCRNVGL